MCILLDPEFQEIIPFLKLIGDHFGDDVKRNGDHFGVGIISVSIWGSSRYGVPRSPAMNEVYTYCFDEGSENLSLSE